MSKKISESNGTSSVKIRPPSENQVQGTKTKFRAYLLWLFGGIFGAHHFYLDRDDHGFLWWSSLGGYFGAGWIRDLFKIPTYVADANNEPQYIEWFKNEVRTNKKV